MQAMGKGFQTL
jgi:hypothetical protein